MLIVATFIRENLLKSFAEMLEENFLVFQIFRKQ